MAKTMHHRRTDNLVSRSYSASACERLRAPASGMVSSGSCIDPLTGIHDEMKKSAAMIYYVMNELNIKWYSPTEAP